MNYRTLSVSLVFTIFFFPSAPHLAYAETLDMEKALILITDTADKICNVVSTSGEANSSEVKGDVSAQLGGLASKLAALGISGTGSITSEHYQNVLRSDLAATLKTNADCKSHVFDALQTKLLGPDPMSDISGTWYDPNDPTSVAQITQHGQQVEFTKTGTLQSGIRYEISGIGTLWGSTFKGEYQARYQNGFTSTGYCWGALPRQGFETSTCKDTYLGLYTASMVHE